MVGFLASFLREEGGYDFKKAIVDSIVELMGSIPEVRDSSLLYLCEFIEDCEFSDLIVQIMHIIGTVGPATAAPSRYIRFVFNRVILENALVRAAAVSTLGAFASKVPELRPSLISLLGRSTLDEDDEVRDRAITILQAVQQSKDEAALKFVLDEPMPLQFAALERSLRALSAHVSSSGSRLTQPLSFASLPVVDDGHAVQAAKPSAVNANKKAQGPSKGDDAAPAEVDPAAAVYKVPELASLGRAFRSSVEIFLTETEMEYVVSCTKHIFAEHVVLQFTVLNTVDDQLLQNVRVRTECSDPDLYAVETIIPAPAAKYGERSSCFVCLRRLGPIGPASLSCELQFKLLTVDATTGEVDLGRKGFDEDFPLEDLELSTADFMAKVSTSDFRRSWDGLGSEGEVLEKFSLQFKKLEEAVVAVTDFLGMMPVDGTATIPPDVLASRKPHVLHLSGIFLGNCPVLARAQLQFDESSGVVLKMAVRCKDKDVSQIVAECIR